MTDHTSSRQDRTGSQTPPRSPRGDRLARPAARFAPTVHQLEDRIVPADLGSLNPSFVVLDRGAGADPARASVFGSLPAAPPPAGGDVWEYETNDPTADQMSGPLSYPAFAQSLETVGWVLTDDPNFFDPTTIPHVTVHGNWDAAADNGTFDYYTFEVPTDGAQVSVRVDFNSFSTWPVPTRVFLFSADALAVGTWGSSSNGGLLEGTAPESGWTPYELYVSVEGHAVGGGQAGLMATTAAGSDTYSVQLGRGESVSFAVSGSGSGLQVEVLDAAGNVLAGGGPSVSSFVVPQAGTYTVRVSGSGDYNLLAGRNVTVDDGSNDSIAAAQAVTGPRVHGARWVTGSAGAGDTDFYRITADARATLTLESVKPARVGSTWVRPLIRLYDAAGNLVASNAGDRNGRLQYRVPKGKGGAYFVEVSAPNAAAARDYAVSIEGDNAAAAVQSAFNSFLLGTFVGSSGNTAQAIEANLRAYFERLGWIA